MECKDLEQFDKWSGEFRDVLTEFKQHSLCHIPSTISCEDQEFFNECQNQLCATKALIKLADGLNCTGHSDYCTIAK